MPLLPSPCPEARDAATLPSPCPESHDAAALLSPCPKARDATALPSLCPEAHDAATLPSPCPEAPDPQRPRLAPSFPRVTLLQLAACPRRHRRSPLTTTARPRHR
ncbi:hypothetical protein ACJRO7_008634 [Eucalyptus globulus]|uniref:Uncharacterized protein n=1 Tax=Eucalyptus globulus TaxID=34317 RepID=A0ABD3IS55_EUCGL